jgi:hypothetical protein
MTAVLKPALQHSYGLSAFERKDHDFYPTPADLLASLPVGLARLGLELPRVALDPCGGDGALRRGLTPFGIDVRLSDLYPERYPEADGYATSQPLDAAEPRELRHAFELAGSDCTAIITNTPHNTVEACAIVRNLIALVEGQHVEFIAVRSGPSEAQSQDDCPFSIGRHSTAKSFAAGVLGGLRGPKRVRARLRVVRLEKGPPARSIFEGSRRQARNHRGPVSGLLKRD